MSDNLTLKRDRVYVSAASPPKRRKKISKRFSEFEKTKVEYKALNFVILCLMDSNWNSRNEITETVFGKIGRFDVERKISEEYLDIKVSLALTTLHRDGKIERSEKMNSGDSGRCVYHYRYIGNNYEDFEDETPLTPKTLDLPPLSETENNSEKNPRNKEVSEIEGFDFECVDSQQDLHVSQDSEQGDTFQSQESVSEEITVRKDIVHNEQFKEAVERFIEQAEEEQNQELERIEEDKRRKKIDEELERIESEEVEGELFDEDSDIDRESEFGDEDNNLENNEFDDYGDDGFGIGESGDDGYDNTPPPKTDRLGGETSTPFNSPFVRRGGISKELDYKEIAYGTAREEETTSDLRMRIKVLNDKEINEVNREKIHKKEFYNEMKIDSKFLTSRNLIICGVIVVCLIGILLIGFFSFRKTELGVEEYLEENECFEDDRALITCLNFLCEVEVHNHFSGIKESEFVKLMVYMRKYYHLLNPYLVETVLDAHFSRDKNWIYTDDVYKEMKSLMESSIKNNNNNS